jgi:hypothetical protein
MAWLRTSLASERYVFHWSMVSIVACLLLVGMSSLAWLREDLSVTSKVTLELVCCTFLALDLYFHHHALRSLLKNSLLRVVTMAAVIPWYTFGTTILSLPDHSMMVFLSHASYSPYLYFRFRSYTREHIAPLSVKMALVLVLVCFSFHWLASIWMILRPKPDVDFSTEYNLAMYFLTTTVATVGYGDITPDSNITRLYTMFLQLMGVAMFGIVIGQVSRLIIDADKRKEHAKNQVDSLVSLFKHYDIPADLQKKAYRFLNHVLAHSANEEEQKVLNVLPHGLQAELRTYMNIRPISRVSLFKGCSQACLIEASKEMQQIYFTPHQAIIKKGDVGNEMFLIGHGQVEVLDGERHIAHLSDGQCFGEMALLGDERRGADIRATTHCDVFVLSRDRFQHLLTHHQDLRINVEALMHSRRQPKAS